ncbi:Protein CBG04810 [Caenorhabditis briggsae]|uniref:Protein CBG04810 n=1 Tax=Caenorhabditis briggsae TaxID=6238 RepID=A8WYI8_CAEBR|nr:Protein CBG04810 [Caenorhabditis briggsae]CAP25446.2 Protein CBG04810 [Caenorhabditis briggsae]
MSVINKIEDNLSSAYVEHKLDPIEKSHQHAPEVHATGEDYHRGSRLSDAFVSLNNAIHGDTTHKTGEAFNDANEYDGMERKMSMSKETVLEMVHSCFMNAT